MVRMGKNSKFCVPGVGKLSITETSTLTPYGSAGTASALQRQNRVAVMETTGPHSLKYLPSGSSEDKFADSCSMLKTMSVTAEGYLCESIIIFSFFIFTIDTYHVDNA